MNKHVQDVVEILEFKDLIGWAECWLHLALQAEIDPESQVNPIEAMLKKGGKE